jgi:long-subunit fatty acid transport protein
MWRKLCVITLVLSLIQLAEGSGNFMKLDWNITGSGARAAGMGGAFIGIADDATAINWNPGGLTSLEHFEASYVGNSVSESEELELLFKIRTYNISDGWIEDTYPYKEELSYKHFSPLNFASLVFPMTVNDKKLIIAAAVQKQLDFFSEDMWEDDDWKGESNSEGGVYTANLGASYQITKSFSAGITANLWFGGAEYESYDLYKGTGDEWYYYESMENFSGMNFTLGAMFDVGSVNENIPLRVGAVVKTPFEMSFDYNYEDYENGFEIDSGGIEIKVDMPLMFGLGASYRFGDFFTVGVDFERRNYGKSKIKFSDDDSKFPMSMSGDDVTQFRLGMEYLIVTDNYVVPIRLGAFNYPTLLSDYEYKYTYYEDDFDWYEAEAEDYKQVVGYGLSFGTGLIFDKFAIDLSYSFLTFENKDKYVYNYIYDYADDNNDWIEEWTEEDIDTTTKHTLNLSAILYLDSFFK